MGLMYDMQEDLSVADNMITGLESWLGRWKLPEATLETEPLEVIHSGNVPKIHEFHILYSLKTAKSTGANSMDASQNGVLRVSNEGVTIMQNQGEPVKHFKPRDISEIRVHSPWEVQIVQFQIGQPDICYNIMSTKMPQALGILDVRFKRKMMYQEFPEPPAQKPMPTAGNDYHLHL